MSINKNAKKSIAMEKLKKIVTNENQKEVIASLKNEYSLAQNFANLKQDSLNNFLLGMMSQNDTIGKDDRFELDDNLDLIQQNLAK
jgi:hypothetical protein